MAQATGTPSAENRPQDAQVRRVRKGMRAADLVPGGVAGRELTTLYQIDSPFQLQEYLQILLADTAAKGQITHDDVERLVRLPAPSSGAGLSPRSDDPTYNGVVQDDKPTESHSVETDVWVYEHLKRIVQDMGSRLVPTLQQVCLAPVFGGSVQCSSMNAGPWTFLCAAHEGGERQCPAIDYTQHTLDAITSTLVSPRLFPSRTHVPSTSIRHYASITRRISRIFLHAREHHRDVFDSCETETQLYDRFYTLCKRYGLTQIDGLPLPSALENAQPAQSEFDRVGSFDRKSFTSLRPPPAPQASEAARTARAPNADSLPLHSTTGDELPDLVGRERTGSDASITSAVPNVLGLKPTSELGVHESEGEPLAFADQGHEGASTSSMGDTEPATSQAPQASVPPKPASSLEAQPLTASDQEPPATKDTTESDADSSSPQTAQLLPPRDQVAKAAAQQGNPRSDD